jgi:hypothetical protein
MSAPIPLPNQGGGGGSGMLIAGLVAACSCSSSIGGGIFAFLRMRKKKSIRATKRVQRLRRPRPSNVRSGGAAAIAARARARSARRAARARARASRQAARARRRAARARARNARRARRKAALKRARAAAQRLKMARIKRRFKRRFGRRFRRGRSGKVGRRRRRGFRCFAPETVIQLKNGTTRQMKNLELGDVLINGSIVEATMNIRNHNDPYYKIGDIHVTGSHYVKDGNVYKQVRNFSKAEPTDKVAKVVCCLVTSDHKIPVGDFVFWDWEDNLVPNHIQQPSKVMTLRNRSKNVSVVGDK